MGETAALLGEKEVVQSGLWGGMGPKQVQTVKKAVWFEWMLSWASVGQSCSALDVLGHLDLQVLILI